jgi:hypothetical protein
MGLAGDIRVINLSASGAMIEHLDRLAPGQPCVLTVPLAGVELRLRARVAWCQVHSVQNLPNGNGEIRFRSGLHFSDLPEDSASHLHHYLARLNAPKSEPTHGLE